MSLSRSIGWTTMGNGLGQACNLLLAVIVARILGPAGFGNFGVAITTAQLLAICGGCGLGYAAMRTVAAESARDPAAAARAGMLALTGSTIGGALAAASAIAAAPWIATAIGREGLAQLIATCAPLTFAMAVSAGAQGVLLGAGRYRQSSVCALLLGLLSLPGAWVGSLHGGAVGAAMGMTVGQLVAAGVGAVLALRALPGPIRGWGSALPMLWRGGLPLLMAAAAVQFAGWAALTLVARGEDGAHQSGLWNAASTWRQLAIFLPVQAYAASIPAIAAGTSVIGPWRLACLHLGLAGPGLLVLLAVAWFPDRLYGASFQDLAAPLWASAPGVMFSAIGLGLQAWLLGTGRPWAVVWAAVAYAAVTITLLLVPSQPDAVGAAVAASLASLAAIAPLALSWRRRRPATGGTSG